MKFTRTLKTTMVTVSTRESKDENKKVIKSEQLEQYPVERKTTEEKEFIRAIKKHSRTDLIIDIKETVEKREMDLETFMKHSTVVVEETETEETETEKEEKPTE